MAAYCPFIETFETLNNHLLHSIEVRLSPEILKTLATYFTWEQRRAARINEDTYRIAFDWEGSSNSKEKRLHLGAPGKETLIPFSTPLYTECVTAVEAHRAKVNPLNAGSL